MRIDNRDFEEEKGGFLRRAEEEDEVGKGKVGKEEVFRALFRG